MRRIFFLYVSFLCLLQSCSTPHYYLNREQTPVYAPKLTVLHLIDRNGMQETISGTDRLEKYQDCDFLTPQPYGKVLRVFGGAGVGKVKALVTSYYDNGQVRQYLEIVDNRAYGYYREWYDNGQLHLEGFIIGGTPDISAYAESTWLFDGVSRVWDVEGKLTALVHYSKGKLEGESLYYHANGLVWKRSLFENGQLDGISEIFYSDGNLLQELYYEKGQLHGCSTRYWSDGSLAAQEGYERGSLISGIYRNRQGQDVAEICDGSGYRAVFGAQGISELHEYRYGRPEGEIRQLDTTGHLVRSWYVKDDLKHGPQVEYYGLQQASGRPKMEINWSEGKIQGSVKTWYTDGTQESQREMSNNHKNGLLTAWYRDGSLMLAEDYENDILRKGEYYRRGDKIPVSEVREGDGEAFLYDIEGNLIRKIHYRDGKPFE